jgi:hypothetical protein
MGTWGTAIFSDDLASDIKDDFRLKIALGKSVELAVQELKNEYQEDLQDEKEHIVFWLALASTQWKLGRLQEEVKIRAINIIESESDLKRWEDDLSDYKKRQKVLQKLKDQLLSKQPEAKKIAFPFISETKMEVGDLIKYEHQNGKYALFRVLRIKEDHRGDRYPQVEFLNYFDEKIPHLKIVEDLDRKFKPAIEDELDAFKPSGTYYIGSSGKKDIEPWRQLEKIGTQTKPTGDFNGSISLIWWKNLDDFISALFE